MPNIKNNIAGTVRQLLTPIADEMGLSLWDVEFVREGSRRILRITIDKPDGVNIDDCEAFHRTIDPVLDEADPIDSSYYLEVSSPGIERELKYDEHFLVSIGQTVEVKLFAPDSMGRKSVQGTLVSYADGVITVENAAGRCEIKKSSAAKVSTVYDFNDD